MGLGFTRRKAALRDGRLTVLVNSNVTMSRGKYAAQAVHAALAAAGVTHGPVVVLGGKPAEIRRMAHVVHDAGWTEVAPGTLTAGARWEGEPSHRAVTRPSPENDSTGDVEFSVTSGDFEFTGSMDLRRVIVGALRDTIETHGPITPENMNSAVKRVHAQVRAALRNGRCLAS